MATKPIVQPELWASNAVYTTGPFIGSPGKVVPGGPVAAEGHRPGSAFPTPAEYENSQQNRITDLVRWVFLGSSAGAADAHIVETNAAGRATLHGLTVDDSADETAASIFSSGVASPGLFVQNLAGGGAVVGDTGNTNASCFACATGSGGGIALSIGMFGTVVGGCGVNILTDAATAAPGIVINHNGSGYGLEVNHGGSARAFSVQGGSLDIAAVITGGTGQSAIIGTSGSNASAAIGALGVGTARGLVASGGTGGAAATAVDGTALHADALGVHGKTSASASATAAGVRGEALGAGATGVHALSTVGRPLVVQGDTSSPAYPAMRIIPQNADPSAATNDGELYWSDTHKTLRTCVAGYGYRSMPTMGPGSAFTVSESQAFNTATPYGGSYVDVLTVLCDTSTGTGFYGSANNAEVLIMFSAEVRSLGVAGTDRAEIEVTDMTNAPGTPIAEWDSAISTDPNGGFALPGLTDDWQRTITFGLRYAPTSDGDLEIRVRIKRNAAGVNQEFRNAVLTVTGTF